MNIQLAQKRFKLIIAILIPTIFFTLIFMLIPVDDIIESIFSADITLIILSLIPLGISILLSIIRWKYILKVMGYSLSIRKSIIVYMATLPLSSITPSKSGDLIRAYYLKDDVPITTTMGSVIIERFFDLLILIMYCYLGMIFTNNFEYGLVISLFLIILISLFITFQKIRITSNKPLIEKISRLLRAFESLDQNKESYIILFVISGTIWFLAIVQSLILFQSLSIHVPIIILLAGIPIGIFIGMLPISLGGMGTRDAAFIYIFSDYSSVSNLLIFGILYTFLRYWLLALIGIPFMKLMSSPSNHE